MILLWLVSFHNATSPAIIIVCLQSKVYKNKIFCTFLNHD